MSKFLDRLDKISSGPSNPMGFGAARAEKVPGLALVAIVSQNHTAAIAGIADLAPDAALLSGLTSPKSLKKLVPSLSSVPWGTRLSSLNDEEAQAYREGGCDLLAFSLTGTSVSAVASDEIARILCVDPSIEERELRAIDSLPVDVLLLPMKEVSGSWTLLDLATVGAVSRRVSKYILVEVSQPPAQGELEAMRDVGVHGLAVDVSTVSAEALGDLKTALLEMPRRRTNKRERHSAILPGSVYSMGNRPTPEEEDDDE